MLSVLGPLRKKERMIIKPRLIPAGSVTVFLVFNLLIDQKPRMVVNKKKKVFSCSFQVHQLESLITFK